METIRATGGRRQWRGFIATPWSPSRADHRTILAAPRPNNGTPQDKGAEDHGAVHLALMSTIPPQ
jgi:hypothetical protein